MKIFWLLILSAASALAQALPQYQRTIFTTNVAGATIPSPRMSDIRLYTGMTFEGTLWSMGILGTEWLFENSNNGYVPLRFRDDGTLVVSNLVQEIGAAPGKLLTSDATGLMSWSSPSHMGVSGGYAIEDFSLYAPTNSPTIDNGIGWTESGIVTATAQIVPRVWADGITRNVLQFNGRGEYVRKFPWGTNWQQIRIGILSAITNAGVSITNSYAFGIGAGTNSGYYQTGNSNFVGFGNDVTGNTFVLSNSLISPYYSTVFFRGVHKTNTVTQNGISVTSSSGNGWGIIPRFTEMIINVTRADYITNETITIGYHNPVNLAPPDSGSYVVLDGMPAMPQMLFDVDYETTTGIQNTASTQGTVTLNTQMNTAGALDAVCLSWGYSGDIMEIGGIIVRKIR